MVSREKTIDRLNREKDREEKLVDILSNFYLSCLDDIKDITEEEKSSLKTNLETLNNDSHMHLQAILGLLEIVVENGTQDIF